MKIKVNYDLIDKIKESKSGISLKRSSKRLLLTTGFTTLLSVPSFFVAENPVEKLKSCLSIALSVGFVYRIMYDVFFYRELYKDRSLDELKKLVGLLRKNYINIDYELLQSASEYDRSYSVVLDDNKNLRLKQDKYIMVPVVDRFGKKEVSLVQEHLIGSSEYELSCGSPSEVKVLKFAYNGI